MSLYTLLLFLHISGAVCLFSGMGIWLFGITAITCATQVEQIRTLADLLLMVRLVVPAAALLVIAAGISMTWIAWGFQTGWIVVALGSLAIIGPIGTWVVDPKVRAIAKLAQALPDGPLSAALSKHAHDSMLRLMMHILVAMLFGIVFLMTTKPAFASALGGMLVSAGLGLISGVPFLITRHSAFREGFQQHDEEAQ